jgi:hypothetical protein
MTLYFSTHGFELALYQESDMRVTRTGVPVVKGTVLIEPQD